LPDTGWECTWMNRFASSVLGAGPFFGSRVSYLRKLRNLKHHRVVLSSRILHYLWCWANLTTAGVEAS
jgi:hypothetical protein